MTGLEASRLEWQMETIEARRMRPTRSTFCSIESQTELGHVELAIAMVCGLLAAIARSRPIATPLTDPP